MAGMSMKNTVDHIEATALIDNIRKKRKKSHKMSHFKGRLSHSLGILKQSQFAVTIEHSNKKIRSPATFFDRSDGIFDALPHVDNGNQ